MKKLSLIIAVIGILAPVSLGQERRGEKFPQLKWRALRVMKSQFPRSMGMIDSERDDYATNLAGVAIIHLRENKADDKSRELARKMILLALHLSNQNRKAVVFNGRLGRGEMPEAPQVDYSAKTLGLLLMNRAKLLEKQEGESNVEVAGYFFDLASELDPKSEDAIYHSELFRINHGEVDWNKLLLNRE